MTKTRTHTHTHETHHWRTVDRRKRTQIHICKNHKFIRNKSLSYTVLRRINYFIIIIIFTVQVRQQSEAWMIFSNETPQSIENWIFIFVFISVQQHNLVGRNRTYSSNFNGNSFFIQWQMRHNSLTHSHIYGHRSMHRLHQFRAHLIRFDGKIKSVAMMGFKFLFFLHYLF